MVIASSLVCHHGLRVAALLALAAMALCVLVLLAYAASSLGPGTTVPTLDGPRVGPFRWTDPGGTA